MEQVAEGGGSLAAKPLMTMGPAPDVAQYVAQEKRRQALQDAQTLQQAMNVLERRGGEVERYGPNLREQLHLFYLYLLNEAAE